MTLPMDLPPRPPALGRAAHKGDAGRVVVLAGSRELPGAALLAVGGALRAGAGLVTLGCLDPELLVLLPVARPEALPWDLTAGADGAAPDSLAGLGAALGARAADVVLCGPGIGRGPRAGALVEAVLADWGGPLVLDADALNELAAEPTRLVRLRARGAEAVTVLTPHPGEAARLLAAIADGNEGARAAAARTLLEAGGLGDRPEARAAAAALLAAELDAVVCLKGAGTVVASRGGGPADPAAAGPTWTNPSGNPGLATGGTGDVLAGCLAALLVSVAGTEGEDRDRAAVDAARAAVYLHGLSGDRAAARLGSRGMLAGDLLDELGPAEAEGPWAE